MEISALYFPAMLALCAFHMLVYIPSWQALRRAMQPPGAGDRCSATMAHFQRKRQEAWGRAAMCASHVNGVSLIWAAVRHVVWLRDSKYAEFREWYTAYHICWYLFVALVLSPCLNVDHRVARLLKSSASQCWGSQGGHSSRSRCTTLHAWMPDRYTVVHGIIMGSCIVLVMMYNCQYRARELGLVRMAVSVVDKRLWPAIAWNALFLVCKVFRVQIMAVVAPSYPVDACVNEVNAWDDYFEIVFIVAISYLVRSLALEEASSATSAWSQRNERKALTAILNATCDVVVQVDVGLKVVGPTPKLAAMLLRPTASMDRIDFASLFPEDVDVVAHSLQESATGDGTDSLEFAKVFGAKLQDVSGSAVPVHGFHTPFTDLDGSFGHLIGLCEQAPQPAFPPLPEVRDTRRRHPGGSEAAVRRTAGALGSEAHTPSDAASSQSASGSTNRPEDSPTPTAPESWGDLLYPDRAPTMKLAYELSLLRLMLQWNFFAGGCDCCSYHTGTRLLQAVVTKMKRHSCFELNAHDLEGSQCTWCGLVSCQPAQGGSCCAVCEELWLSTHLQL